MPNRHYENSQGDFYVECGVCTSCGAPEAEAPDLIDHSQQQSHSYLPIFLRDYLIRSIIIIMIIIILVYFCSIL